MVIRSCIFHLISCSIAIAKVARETDLQEISVKWTYHDVARRNL